MNQIALPSPMYPFTLDQLDRYEFGRYTLCNVFERVDSTIQKECVDLWMSHGAISNLDAAQQRSHEVCYCLRLSENQALIGVNTLYPANFRLHQANPALAVWVNRMFIAPEYRDSRLMIVGTAMMVCFAKTRLSDRPPIGIVNVNENRKLSRPGVRRVFHRLGYRRLGQQNGNEVLLFNFSQNAFVSMTQRDTNKI